MKDSQERFHFCIKYDQEGGQNADIGHHGEGRELVQIPDPRQNHNGQDKDSYPGTPTEVDVECQTEDL